MTGNEANRTSTRLKTTETVDSCTICKSTAIEVGPTRELSYCPKCRFYFLNPRPNQEDITASYNSGQTFDDWQRELPDRTPLWEKRMKLILRYKTTGRLLDFGTGDGFFLEFASVYFDVDSTEISEKGVAYARKRGFNPIQGGLESLDIYTRPRYDVITLWHVLEHVPDPGTVLERMFTLLKPGGILIVAVPNESFNLLKAKSRVLKKNKDWPSYRRGKEIHLNYFIPKSLKDSLKRVGLQILDFQVDDVHIWRTARVLLFFHFNRFLNALFNWHVGRAMAVIARKPLETNN